MKLGLLFRYTERYWFRWITREPFKTNSLLEEEIHSILLMGQTVQEFDLDVKVGDTVRIIDGAFYRLYW